MIDVSALTVDSPEVAELKARVREVADKYTKRNGWCSEVKKALKEAGIDQEDVKVEVVTTIGTKQVTVDPRKLAGLDNDGQLAFFAELIGPVKLPSPWVGEVQYEVTDVNLVGGDGSEGEETWAYVSNDGRVMHLKVEGSYYSACGVWFEPNGNTHDGIGYLTSSRGESRRCVKCNRIDSQ